MVLEETYRGGGVVAGRGGGWRGGCYGSRPRWFLAPYLYCSKMAALTALLHIPLHNNQDIDIRLPTTGVVCTTPRNLIYVHTEDLASFITILNYTCVHLNMY